MKTPFTGEQFLEVFKEYNQTVFPIQIVFYLLSYIVIHLAIKPSSKSHKIIAGLLSFFWLWMGIVYHLIFFKSINKAAYLFGSLFIIQGLLFLVLGVFQNKLSFKFRSDKYGIAGIILAAFALLVYPVLGYSFGHVYPSSPTFGLPCPTAIFTFGMLLFSDKKCPVVILIIPIIWSIIGFSAVINFGIVEDIGLLVSGIFALILIFIRNKLHLKK